LKPLLLSLFLLTQAIQAQQSSYSEVLDRFHSEKQFNGVVLVATNGTIDFLGSVGTANRELGSPLSPTSRFRIASMSKVFTAVLVMNLVEEGKG
jgi:CubicO group peptidase (beta-lactamase class C family)